MLETRSRGIYFKVEISEHDKIWNVVYIRINNNENYTKVHYIYVIMTDNIYRYWLVYSIFFC